jgi:glutathione peroxidase
MAMQPMSTRDAHFSTARDTLRALKICSSVVLSAPFISRAASGPESGIGDIAVEYDGASKPIKEYLGSKATLIVNVASYCALTPQYADLVALYDKYKNQGFTILAFPCNQFGSQEPSPVPKIRKDMNEQFGVTFPIFDKIDVNGPSAHPLYQKLKSYEGISSSNVAKISWNFEKFLVDANGMPVRRYKPGIEPFEVEGDLAALLKTGTVPPRKKAVLNDY